jgi:hypothetical protein
MNTCFVPTGFLLAIASYARAPHILRFTSSVDEKAEADDLKQPILMILATCEAVVYTLIFYFQQLL